MFRRIFTLCLCLMLACGCERRRETAAKPVADEDYEYLVAVLVDLSGSFLDKMTEGGQAHDFMLSLIDRYFKERVGTNDQIIIAQISNTPGRSLLWQGSPHELRKRFPNSRAFSDFLRSKADPYASYVHDAVAQTVEYVMTQPNVSNKRSAVFALTDMLDNDPHSAESKDRAVQALSEYGKIGGTVCLYYVDQRLVPVWQRELQATGLTFIIEPEIKQPRLPNFE